MNHETYLGRSSDLLPGWPYLPTQVGQWRVWAAVLELTAAGQFRIFTEFPFNHAFA